jgi:hypothetical protein
MHRSGTSILLTMVSFAISASAGATPGILQVSGGAIVDGDGSEVMLRGFNMDLFYHLMAGDPEAPFRYAGREDIERLADMGVTAVRLCLNWKLFRDDSGYELIDDYIEWCREEGIYIILDMHVVPPNDRAAGREIWDEGGDALVELWSEIAARYRGEAVIAGYDLFNEPSPTDRTIWWELSRRLVASVRGADPEHIVFVDAGGYWENGFQPIEDPALVYTVHFYEPFLVTHAGAGWGGDSPVPEGYSYPGDVLTGVEWLSGSTEAVLEDPAARWARLDTGALTPPEDAQWATVKLGASGNSGAVFFDDVEIEVDGVAMDVWNPGFEDRSPARGEFPANWFPHVTDGDFAARWSDGGHSGDHCALLDGTSGSAYWSQSLGTRTDPLIPLEGVGSIRLTCWVKAPDNLGLVGLRADYITGEYEYFDREALLDAIRPVATWAAAHGSPLYVGELGVIAAAPEGSQAALAADMISVMDQLGLHWTWWTYRDAGENCFGLFAGDGTADPDLLDALTEGLRASGSRE